MADEVTKKDLQSLYATFNKHIADIKKRLDKAEGDIAILKDVPTAQDQAISKLFMDITDNLRSKIYELQSEVKALKKG